MAVCGPLVELYWHDRACRRVAQVSGAYSHVSQKKRDMGHPISISFEAFQAAGGRIFITRISVSLIFTGPTYPDRYQRKLLQRHCSGEATNPRATGLRWM